MERVSVSALRQKLHEYLARVQRGERLRAVSRGRVIAEIAPPAPSRDEIAAARARLRGSVRHDDRPLDPAVASAKWDVNR